MAKAGVDLKSIVRAIEEVDRQVRALAKEPAPRSVKSEMTALRRALKGIRSKVTAQCLPGMFRAFELGETTAGRPARKKAAPSRKR